VVPSTAAILSAEGVTNERAVGKTTVEITHKSPVQFRVVSVVLDADRTQPPPSVDEIVLRIENVNNPKTHDLGMTRARYLPYREALNDAIKSGTVYWVDWDVSAPPAFPPRFDEPTIGRLLDAIKNGQTVSSDPPDER